MGYQHTDGEADLMVGVYQPVCEKPLSAREVYHAGVAYGRPVGSLDR
jgi:hypothetical protein